ncbi:MAG: glutathione S-transferase family protein [Betaproteobacteria bacterium]|nr:glutathione S-transferase family protein [Betaproteobacteria bacterium]PWB63066.1 MAG: glutathione S-transferase family protein [Betaproteobacteria bacterium]
MTLRIYGIAASRAIRALWMAEELGLAYEHVPIHYRDDPDGPLGKNNADFRRANPLGRVPAIDDDGYTLWESMAINLYLARKHGKGLWPATVEGEGLAYQWSFFAVTEIDPDINTWAANAIVLPEDKRDPAKAQAALEKLQRPLAVVDAALAHRPYLAGGAFTVADLNLAAALFRARRMDHAARPNLARWLADCFSRPAARRAWAMRGE